MDKKELLTQFVDSVANEDGDSSLNLMKEYSREKVKDIVNEFIGDSPIKFRGDEVFVNNKLIGRVDTDMDDMDSGIIFTSVQGKKAEVNDMKALYKFIENRYLGEGADNIDDVLAEMDKEVRREKMNKRLDSIGKDDETEEE